MAFLDRRLVFPVDLSPKCRLRPESGKCSARWGRAAGNAVLQRRGSGRSYPPQRLLGLGKYWRQASSRAGFSGAEHHGICWPPRGQLDAGPHGICRPEVGVEGRSASPVLARGTAKDRGPEISQSAGLLRTGPRCSGIPHAWSAPPRTARISAMQMGSWPVAGIQMA